MKKILHVVEAFGGGIFTYLVDLSNRLTNDYDVYIAYSIRPQTPKNFTEYFLPSIHLIELKEFRRGINLLKDIKAFNELKKIVKDINPDIVHLHSSKAGVIGRYAISGKNIKLFYTPHGYSFLMKDQNKLKRQAYYLIEKIAAKQKCKTISCSKGEHETTLNLTTNACYISNGVNINELKAQLQELPNKTPKNFTVFTLGRICYQKNPDLFNKIALSLPDVHFIWIGDGDLKNKLSAPNIQVTGWLERKDALKIACYSDAFILTSLWEGLPISLLEAMYMKKTCFVTDVIGNKDVIRNRINGFICKNELEFKCEIHNYMVSPSDEYAKNAYNDIICEYNTDVMCYKYKCVYEGN